MPASTRLLVSLTISLSASLAFGQESRALLHVPMIQLPVDSAPLQRLGDFDGDGDLDVVGTRVFSDGLQNEITVWENQQGALTQVWQGTYPLLGVQAGVRTLLVATGDFNGDQLTDFAVAGGVGAVIYTAQPGFSFQTSTFPTTNRARQLTTGDFDADGLVDLAVEVTGTMHLLLGAGPVITGNTSSLSAIRVQALELDGLPGDDLLLTSEGATSAFIWALDAGQLTFRFSLNATVFSGAPMWMGGDLDLDGDTDLVVFRGQEYQVFRRTAPATLTAETPQIGGPAEYLADIDGDGDLDGVCCGGGGGGGGSTPSWPHLNFESTYQLSINDGTGAFAPAWSIPGAGSESMAGAADMDGDGDIDLVAGRCIFYGRGPWREEPTPVAAGPDSMSWFRPQLLRDFDRDGDPDIVTFSKLINDGHGGLLEGAGMPQPPIGQFTDFFNIDIDGDGAVEQLALRTSGTFTETSLLQNNGGGHLTYAGPAAGPGLTVGTSGALVPGYEANFVVDLDGDGDEDLLTGWSSTNRVYWNNGGTFVPGQTMQGSVRAVADFDGDGHMDLLVNTNSLTLLRGAGAQGQFQPVWTGLSPIYQPAAQIAADVNDDGLPDFVVPDVYGDLTLYINTTVPGVSYGFTRHVLPIQIPVPTQLTAVRPTITAGDFDGDGKTDLALGPIIDPVTGVERGVGAMLRRIGWSTPPTLADYEVTKLVFESGFAADVDGDGDIDLVGDRLARNPRFHSEAAGSRLQMRAGTAGEFGAVPVLSATGPFRGGEVEVLRLTGVPGPTLAWLAWSLADLAQPVAPLPGLSIWLDPTLSVIGAWPIDEDGQGRAAAMNTLTVFVPPGLQGLSIYSQALVFDPVAPGALTQSNVLRQRFGN